jgi:hypothetical protein
MVQDQHHRRCNIKSAADRVLAMGNDLKRNNASKWAFSVADWQAAIDDVLKASETQQNDVLEKMCRRIRSAVRRLANSGEARFGSENAGRLPDSSLAGERFCKDLEALHECLLMLHSERQRLRKIN